MPYSDTQLASVLANIQAATGAVANPWFASESAFPMASSVEPGITLDSLVERARRLIGGPRANPTAVPPTVTPAAPPTPTAAPGSPDLLASPGSPEGGGGDTATPSFTSGFAPGPFGTFLSTLPYGGLINTALSPQLSLLGLAGNAPAPFGTIASGAKFGMGLFGMKDPTTFKNPVGTAFNETMSESFPLGVTLPGVTGAIPAAMMPDNQAGLATSLRSALSEAFAGRAPTNISISPTQAQTGQIGRNMGLDALGAKLGLDLSNFNLNDPADLATLTAAMAGSPFDPSPMAIAAMEGLGNPNTSNAAMAAANALGLNVNSPTQSSLALASESGGIAPSQLGSIATFGGGPGGVSLGEAPGGGKFAFSGDPTGFVGPVSPRAAEPDPNADLSGQIVDAPNVSPGGGPGGGGVGAAAGASGGGDSGGPGPGAAGGPYRGGMTKGPRTKRSKTPVHGQEFVVNATATNKYRPWLEAMNRLHQPNMDFDRAMDRARAFFDI